MEAATARRLGRTRERSRANCVQKLFGYSKAKATKLMLQVHYEGKAIVANGTREKCELDVSKLHAAGLWATMQQD